MFCVESIDGQQSARERGGAERTENGREELEPRQIEKEKARPSASTHVFFFLLGAERAIAAAGGKARDQMKREEDRYNVSTEEKSVAVCFLF